MEEEKKGKKITLLGLLAIFLCILIVLAMIYIYLNKYSIKSENPEPRVVTGETTKLNSVNEYALTDNNFSKFDFSFLKFENKKANKIYSPLSIKYAFKMLEEATTGEAQNQIASIVQAYNLTKYKSSQNMALANSFFIRNTFKNSIKDNYISLLKSKYDADIEFDDFSNASKINNWVKENTLNLIPELMDDDSVSELDFALINALGIDMEWNHKFLVHDYEEDNNIVYMVNYYHEKMPDTPWSFNWMAPEAVNKKEFYNNQEISGMEVYASLNNYDIVKELGEDKIRETVYNDFKDWALNQGKYTEYGGHGDEAFNDDYSEENIKKVFDGWFDGTSDGPMWSATNISFIDELNENKENVNYSTDFSIYVDDDVKVFAKDLKEYDGTTLQYVGIMPINEDLDEYVNKIEYTDILNLVNNLKELKRENFKDGYLTYIHGHIPKFSFEYELNLIDDLKEMGVTDVFEQGKANLTNMTDEKNAYINTAKHKANIEFTQDGIKAAAATFVGGAGAGDWYDYLFDMPTEEIDITFDKPYMFLIRDKKTGETWFVGTVYEPLKWEEDNTREEFYDWNSNN